MKLIILCALALLILTSAAFADEATRRNNLDARYLHLECRADLVKAQSGVLSKLVDSTPAADTVNSNMEKLREYADSGDIKGFNTYARTTLTTSFKTYSSRLITARNAYKDMNRTQLQKREGLVRAVSDWRTAINAFSDCNSNARRRIADVRAQQITNAIEDWNKVTEDMKAKGLNTTAQEEVISDAERLIALIQEAQQITDDAEFNAKVEEIRQLHLHLWARFNIAKIESYLQKIEPQAIEAGETEPVRQIKSLLSSSKVMAAKGDKYAEGEFEQTWQNIRQAGEKLKEQAKSLRGDSQ